MKDIEGKHMTLLLVSPSDYEEFVKNISGDAVRLQQETCISYDILLPV